MKIKEYRLYGQVSAGGAGTFTSESPVFGLLYAVQWIDGTLADNNTAVLSTINTEGAETLLTLGAGEGDADVKYYPRALVCDASATALTGTAGGDRVCPLVWGNLQLVIADGGVSTYGGCIAYVMESD
jgi:hypothetical protein